MRTSELFLVYMYIIDVLYVSSVHFRHVTHLNASLRHVTQVMLYILDPHIVLTLLFRCATHVIVYISKHAPHCTVQTCYTRQTCNKYRNARKRENGRVFTIVQTKDKLCLSYVYILSHPPSLAAILLCSLPTETSCGCVTFMYSHYVNHIRAVSIID